MKNFVRFFVGSCLLALLACLGCGVENSDLEKQQAQQEMDKAKTLYAEDIAPADWKEAMQIWDQAQAAVQNGKPAKTLFLRAKNRFEKIAAIAKSRNDVYSKDLSDMQLTINSRFERVKQSLQSGKVSPKVLDQVKGMAQDIEQGNASIVTLVSQGNYFKAYTTAKQIQTQVYNAELVMAGKKPGS